MEKSFAITDFYSEIPKLQRQFTITYSASRISENQIMISVTKREKNCHAVYESCIVYDVSFQTVENLLKFFSENSVCEKMWINTLEDLNISFDVVCIENNYAS